MADPKIATVYAEALLDLVFEISSGADVSAGAGALEGVEQELRELVATVQGDPLVWDFFRSPVVRSDARREVFEKVLAPVLSKNVYNFVGVLNERGRLAELPAILNAFVKLADKKLGRRRVTVYSAQQLSGPEREELFAAVQSYFSRNVILESELRPDLIGGLVVRSEDHVLDTSIQSRLKRFKQVMLDQKIAGKAYYEN